MAPLETDTDSSVSAKKSFRIVFLHSDRRILVSSASINTPLRSAQPKRRLDRDRRLVRYRKRAACGMVQRPKALSIAAKFTSPSDGCRERDNPRAKLS
jgi:hypothetical protein